MGDVMSSVLPLLRETGTIHLLRREGINHFNETLNHTTNGEPEDFEYAPLNGGQEYDDSCKEKEREKREKVELRTKLTANIIFVILDPIQ